MTLRVIRVTFAMFVQCPLSANSGHFAVSQQTTFRAMNDFLHCRRKASLFADYQQDPVTRISVK
jgi:hypothetical protein